MANPKWLSDGGRVRTALGEQLFVAVTEWLNAHGLSQRNKGALWQAVEEIRRAPPFDEFNTAKTLYNKFYLVADAAPLPPPAIDPRDHYVSVLQIAGADPAGLRKNVERIFALSRPERRDGLCSHLDRIRRHRKDPNPALESWIVELEKDPWWLPSYTRPDRTADRDARRAEFIEWFKAAGGRMSKQQFRRRLRKKSPRLSDSEIDNAAANYLHLMHEERIIKRSGDGEYALQDLEIEPYAPVSQRVFEVLVRGPKTQAEIAEELDLDKPIVGAAIQFLRRIGLAKPSTHKGSWTRPKGGGPKVRLGKPAELSVKAKRAVAARKPVRGGDGRVLWQPPELR